LNAIKARIAALPKGTVALTVGLGLVGATTYLFLLITGQVLGDDGYAPLGAMWTLVYLTAPGFFFPIEQEVSRALAARRAQGLGGAPVVRRAALFSAGLVVILATLALVAGSHLESQLFNDSALLYGGFILSLGTFGAMHVARGALAGSGELGWYGALMTTEGVGRLIGTGVLAALGVAVAGPYGIVVGAAPLLAALVVAPKLRKLLQPGPEVPWRELSGSLRDLIGAAIFSQALVNLAPLVVKYAASPAEQALSGAFTKAVIITRIPLFLFQAVQAAMLPRLSHMATEGEYDAFRRLLMGVLGVVAVIGIVAALASFAFAPLLLEIFGSDYGLPRTDLALLAIGNGLFLLAMGSAQALIALEAQRSTVWAWMFGLLAFVLFCLIPMPIVLRVELALIAGGTISFCLMLWAVQRRLSEVEVKHLHVHAEDELPQMLGDL